jgi:DNA-binding LacI/PurR family transcriptional regulator
VKKLTLKSVAQELGVSTATISNAFNNPTQLSKTRRVEILSRCKELGYTGPNKAARSLRRGKTGIIALVLADSIPYIVNDEVASTFISGVSQTLENRQQQLLLVSGASDNLNNVNDFVDGYLCYGPPRNAELINDLRKTTKPVVTVDFNIDEFPSVNIDNDEACYQIAKRTLRANDTVAVIGLRLIDTPLTCRIYDVPMLDPKTSVTRRRLLGYEKAFAEEGVNFNYEQLWSIPENIEAFAVRAAKEVLSNQPRPTIVYCMSDLIAVYFIREAMDMGLRVPEDIRVVGFDGTREGQRFQPNLTTVVQNSDSKGEQAALMLMEQTKQSELLPFSLFYGDSCAVNA